jgi:hypothetical protein
MPPVGINSREFAADAAQARAGSVMFLRPSWHQSAKVRGVGWCPTNLFEQRQWQAEASTENRFGDLCRAIWIEP